MIRYSHTDMVNDINSKIDNIKAKLHRQNELLAEAKALLIKSKLKNKSK